MASPFKFLDAYTREDGAIFFGRDRETDLLYDLIFRTSLIMVYGLAGTGKTSLVQCGLANRFDGPDWYPFFIRRQEDINQSLRRHLEAAIDPEFRLDSYDLIGAVRRLFRLELRPIYLVFDQFEELLLLGSEAEKQQFATDLRALLSAPLTCKIILILREEFIGMLYEFEKVIPTIRDFRLRVEPMSRKHATEVITGTTAEYGIEIEHPDETIPAIIDNISEEQAGIQLSYLQIYLDRLYTEYAGTKVAS